MPAKSEKQRKFMGMELGRKRAGKSTETGMSEAQLRDFAKKPKGAMKAGKPKTPPHARRGRSDEAILKGKRMPR